MAEPQKTNPTTWQALQLYSLYRLIIALMLVGIGKLNDYFQVLFLTNEILYVMISFAYLAISTLWLALAMMLKKHYRLQTNLAIFSDIIFLILLMSASGGILSGIGLLLIVTVAAHALLTASKIAFLSAALITIGLIGSQLIQTLIFGMPVSLFTPVGLMGIVIFATAGITTFLSFRIHKKQHEVEQKAAQLALSEQLNTHIIFALESGILVLDPNYHIQLINTAARTLLGLNNHSGYGTYEDLPEALKSAMVNWYHDHHQDKTTFTSPIGRQTRCQFLSLGRVFSMGTLIFLYDADKETERLQEMKLASLGHLTANIAHELRNPLSAISHAAQLLDESNTLSDIDKDLVVLMKKHCNRINQIIQNVLSISVNKQQHPEIIDLYHWLEDYINTFTDPKYPEAQLKIESELPACPIQVDTSQLTQILNNLVENGLRYSQQFTGEPTLSFQLWQLSTDRIALDVSNIGESLSAEKTKFLFEPFYTTEKAGSGLGLYIAKALSEQNGIHLNYHPTSQQNLNQFRLIFPIGDPKHA